MPDVTRETVTTNDNEQLTRNRPVGYRNVGYLVYLIFGLLDTLLAFRFIFKLLGANPSSGFVDFIYKLSAPFVAPFEGIFNMSVQSGAVTTSVFEPATLIAFVVYALLAWAIVALLEAITGRRQAA